MATTEIVPFATGAGANVQSQAAYAVDPVTATGVVAGKASAQRANKAWRQSSFIAAGIANFCVAQGVSVPDDGDLPTLVTEITTALTALVNSLVPPPFPTGTRMTFNQTAAPTGWVKDTTTVGLNDSLMRIVTGSVGSGGTQAFSTWNGLTVTGAHTLTTAEMPTHTHAVSDPGHQHTGSAYAGNNGGSVPLLGLSPPNASYTTNSAATGISIDNAGSGNSHTHPLTNGVKYFDLIIAQKA